MDPVKAVAPDSGELFQEYLSPFWMIVACCLVNQTHWRVAKTVLAQLQNVCGECSDREAAGKIAAMGSLATILRPLGFQNRRAVSLKRLGILWEANPPQTAEDIRKLPGCGEYAVQSWMIFRENKRPAAVTDHKLQWYLDTYPEMVS